MQRMTGILDIMPLHDSVSASVRHASEIQSSALRALVRGQYSLEAHLNTIAQGTGMRDGTLLPTTHQSHLTLEPTFGLSDNFALGFMFLNAWQPGYTPQFAGLAGLAACLYARVLALARASRIRGGVLVSKGKA